MLTKTQAKIILVLLDNEGHAGWELARILEMEDSNLHPILKKLERMKIIYKGEIRKSRNTQAKKPSERFEFPYYLSNNLDDLRIIIKELVNTDKIYDAGFILGILRESKYIETMQEQYKEELKKTVIDELRNSYAPLRDPFFAKVIEPSFDLQSLAPACGICPISDIEQWYLDYKGNWNSLNVKYDNSPLDAAPNM
ncbi:MAG TPA: hypothetical protein PLI05_10405 [Methanotrichaceae archaeon]|nr:hypothetical protein [Methanotrichaceae archaeon]HQI92042.1 hypothetical protein [Methanotrichaceae archaeon]